MKKFITLASAGFLLLSFNGAWAQRQVEPPPVPPMLEGQRPLAQPETREPSAPKPVEVGKTKPKGKAKTKAKAGQKTQKKAAVAKEGQKKPTKAATKKSLKTQKKKPPEAAPQQRGGPDEG
jgi:hypothetical protein